MHMYVRSCFAGFDFIFDNFGVNAFALALFFRPFSSRQQLLLLLRAPFALLFDATIDWPHDACDDLRAPTCVCM